MSVSLPGIIQKCIINLQFSGQADGFVLEQAVMNWCHNRVPECIEKASEKMNAMDTVYKVDKLEIEIEVDGDRNWQDAVLQQIQQQIRNKFMQISHGAVRSLPLHENFFEVFIHFLQHGILPWWISMSRESFLQELDELIQMDFSDEMRSALRGLSGKDHVQQRLAYQLPDQAFFSLVKKLYPGKDIKPGAFISDIDRIVKQTSAETGGKFFFLFKIAILSALNKMDDKNIEKKIAELFVQKIDNRLSGILIREIDKLQSDHLKEELFKILIQKDFFNRGNKSAEPENEETNKADDKRLSYENEIYITDAGLVIIAPFLPVFFSKLDLVKETKIADINGALCLVKYLVSGKNEVAEFELAFAKILCGIEIESPVDTTIYLTQDEKNEANELLLSVIEYWSILKDTSVEGLRQSFLQREGKLTFNNNEWLLQVEQKGYDMLLRQLPWNISMIKLPWMKCLLKTEWVY